MLQGFKTDIPSNYTNYIPRVQGDRGMEIGWYIDFHEHEGVYDYQGRLSVYDYYPAWNTRDNPTTPRSIVLGYHIPSNKIYRDMIVINPTSTTMDISFYVPTNFFSDKPVFATLRQSGPGNNQLLANSIYRWDDSAYDSLFFRCYFNASAVGQSVRISMFAFGA